jgi:hypothetical protein
MRHQYREPKTGYVSDFEQFMGRFLDDHPAVLESQSEGWHIYWDHRVDLDDLNRMYRNEIPVRGYAYR